MPVQCFKKDKVILSHFNSFMNITISMCPYKIPINKSLFIGSNH